MGGSQAIAALQRSYYAGELPREACVANAQIVFGFTPADADLLFPATAPTPLVAQQPAAPDAPPPGFVESRGGRFYLIEYKPGLVKKVITNKAGKKQTVWVKGDAGGGSPAPAKKAPAKKATPGAKAGITLDDARALLQNTGQGADLAEVGARLAELHNTDLQALKKEFAVKAGGTKAAQAKSLAAAAVAKAKAAQPPAPAAKGKGKAAPQAGQSPEQKAMAALVASPVMQVDKLFDALGMQKGEFDALLIQLADEGKVIFSQDADPDSFTPAQKAKLIQDGGALITTVMASDDALAAAKTHADCRDSSERPDFGRTEAAKTRTHSRTAPG